MAKKLSIYPSLAVPGQGLTSAAILSGLVDTALAGQKDPVSTVGLATLCSCDVPDVESALDLLDPEDPTGKGAYLNVFVLNGDGEDQHHRIRAARFDSIKAAWSYWDGFVALVGWPYPVLKWAEGLERDRLYITPTAETRHVVYVGSHALAAIRREHERSLRNAPVSELVGDYDAMHRSYLIGGREYVEAWQGHEVPADLADFVAARGEAEAEAVEVLKKTIEDDAERLASVIRAIEEIGSGWAADEIRETLQNEGDCEESGS